jgi:hypothetical protein
MDKKIILGVVALVIVSISLLLLAPDNAVHTPDTLPWNITHPTPDTSRIFGITLGKSTLDQTEEVFKGQAEVEISLFKPTVGKLGVEAFVEEVNFNGLKARIVMNIAVPAEELQGMYERGLRINGTPSGKRITLTYDDLKRVRSLPIDSLTYLPNTHLEEDIIIKRFGKPAQRVRENRTDVVHWLYPQHGLDIVMGGKEKSLLQYLSPKDFKLISEPLLASGEILK